jgi:integrase
VGTFVQKLHAEVGITPLALEFVILTCVRTGEGIGARWSEMDLENALWTIPAERMKSRKPHRVPLSTGALAVVSKLSEVRQSDFVFPGGREKRHLSCMAMFELLRRMGRGDITVHGFRSAFRDWAAETTNFPNHLLEMALAHRVEDKVEGAYRRGELLEKRKKLMQAWASYCSNAGSGKVIPIRTAS